VESARELIKEDCVVLNPLKLALAILLMAIAMPVTADTAQALPACASEVLALLHHDPHAMEIYRRHNNPVAFFQWIDCQNLRDFNLPTAVHETTHHLAGNNARRPRLFGLDRQTRVVPDMPLFPRGEILADLPESERDYMLVYLAGEMGKVDLSGLLNELTAYTAEVQSATAIHHRYDVQVGKRDGLARMMHFVALYLSTAKMRFPNVWRRLAKNEDYVEIIKSSWEQAEATLENSCQWKNLGLDDGYILDVAYADPVLDGLRSLPGRPVNPTYPAACQLLARPAVRTSSSMIRPQNKLFAVVDNRQMILKRDGEKLYVNGIQCTREQIEASPVFNLIRDTLKLFMEWKKIEN
jgi:hypothetical protein